MMVLRVLGFASCLLIAAALVSGADESGVVTVRGMHLCCGGCADGAKDALDGIDGVSDVKADVNSKSVVFSAKDEAAAKKGIDALAKHGFFGRAAMGKKDLPFPEVGVKKGEKRDAITFTGIHLCCGACRKAVHEALTKLDGLNSMEIDPSEGRVKLVGAGMTVQSAVDLLQKAGFYGTLDNGEKK